MRAFDRDLIRGGHYGQRSCEPHLQAEHMAAPTNAANVKKVLANSEPSTHVQVFGRRDDEAIHAHLRPASEKRQGRKSREVGSGGAAGAMGLLPRARAREGWSGAVAANGFPPSMGGCVGVNERSARGATRLVARLVVNPAR